MLNMVRCFRVQRKLLSNLIGSPCPCSRGLWSWLCTTQAGLQIPPSAYLPRVIADRTRAHEAEKSTINTGIHEPEGASQLSIRRSMLARIRSCDLNQPSSWALHRHIWGCLQPAAAKHTRYKSAAGRQSERTMLRWHDVAYLIASHKEQTRRIEIGMVSFIQL